MAFKVHRRVFWFGGAFLILSGLCLCVAGPVIAAAPLYSRYFLSEVWAPAFACLVLSVIALGFVPAAFWGLVYPRTLKLHDGKIKLFFGKDLVGEIPLQNIEKVEVLWEVAGRTPSGSGGGLNTAMMGMLGTLGGGIGGGLGAMLREDADPNTRSTATGVKFILRHDRDVFWPKSMRRRGEFCLTGFWDLSYHDIAKTLQKEVASRFYFR